MPSSGIQKEDLENLREILKYCPYFKFICLDVPNGYIPGFKEIVEEISKEYPDKFIIAGNVVTKEGCDLLYNGTGAGGADLVKVGIGSSRVCTTRVVSGVGVPQFSAILECSQNYNIVSDGGCKTFGDVAKAFGAGASMVMLGSMFANHDETGNRLIGMSSKTAMKEFYRGKYKDYRAPEGREIVFDEPSKGPLEITVKNLLGGLRSFCTYVGSFDLENTIGACTFVRVNRTHDKSFAKGDE
jgi:GMP reductase